jgi:hypothetical protein
MAKTKTSARRIFAAVLGGLAIAVAAFAVLVLVKVIVVPDSLFLWLVIGAFALALLCVVIGWCLWMRAGKKNAAGGSSEPGGDTVYWTPQGKSYHADPNCRLLARSKAVSSGTLAQAKAAEKTDPCDNCALPK